MKHKLSTSACACFLFLTMPATAKDLTRLALTLGDVLGAETVCNLSIDPAKVGTFIRDEVPSDDIEFMSTVSTSASIAPNRVAGMTPSLKAAHCAQMERLAASFKIATTP